MHKKPPPPKGTKDAGRRLWRSIVDDYVLEEHELAILRQAAHTADTCAALQAVLDDEGPLKDGRAHPAAVEVRAQRLLLARLLVALRVPLGEQEDTAPARTQVRALRGPYGPRKAG